MSVNNEDIDFKKAFEKSAGPAKPVVKKNEVKQDDVDFSKAFQTSVKKKRYAICFYKWLKRCTGWRCRCIWYNIHDTGN